MEVQDDTVIKWNNASISQFTTRNGSKIVSESSFGSRFFVLFLFSAFAHALIDWTDQQLLLKIHTELSLQENKKKTNKTTTTTAQLLDLALFHSAFVYFPFVGISNG